MEPDSGRGVLRFLGTLLFIAGLAVFSAATLVLRAAMRTELKLAPPSNASAKSTALRDFVGYWVSVVTEEWRYRMVVPDKGDVLANIPLNAAGRRIAESWIPPKTKRRETNARVTALPRLCTFRGDCTFIGRTTTRCESIQILGLKLVCSILVALGRSPRQQRVGRGTRQPAGETLSLLSSVSSVEVL